MLKHEWANGCLNQKNEDGLGKYKLDYISFVKIQSTRHDLAIVEVKFLMFIQKNHPPTS
ncbi:hypothetical protein BDF14DRAFT_1941162 [Spinellus fusiger]|nr:hypothetical protein BDF14DRAFT_1941162 [Spinellus fusiger]